MIIRKAAGEIERMARAGEVVADTLALLGEHARPGVTHEGARRARRRVHPLARRHADLQGLPRLPGLDLRLAERDGRPRHPEPVRAARGRHPLGGRRRDARRLRGDSAYTFAIGEISEEAERLLEGCQAALAAGIEQCRVGNRLSDISHAIQVATEEQGFSVVRSLVGHGVGRSMHEEPQIPNYGEPGHGPQLAEGMTFAIEPMITAGGPDVVLHDDEWSISSADGSLAAHFEHTVAITADGPRILTAATSAVRTMNDPRVEQYAKLLVETCVDVQPGWQVLVSGSALARPLLEEVSRADRPPRRLRDPARQPERAAGSTCPGRARRPRSCSRRPPEIEAYIWQDADALVSIDAPENTRELTGLPAERLALLQARAAPAPRARAARWS